MAASKRWIGLVTLMVIWGFLATGLAANSAAVAEYIVNGNITGVSSPSNDADIKKIEPVSAGYNRYTDYANGYSINYPSQMIVDVSLSPVRTVFADETTCIEVYYDNFAGTVTGAEEYIQYGNRYVTAVNGRNIQSDRWFEVNGYKAHLLAWTRPVLSRLASDQNNYVCTEIIKNSNEIYTILIKSSQPIKRAQEIISGITFGEKQGVPRFSIEHTPSATKMNAETKVFYDQYFAIDSPLRWGIFEPSAPQSIGQLNELEAKLGYKFPMLLHYQMLDEYFPVFGLANAYENGRYVELTLQTVLSDAVDALKARQSSNAGLVYAILDGKYDGFLMDYAQRLKDFGHPVLFRLDNEMNGDWCWYCAMYTDKDAELYKALWRYVHDLFDRNGVDNVIWVWNPNEVSRPAFQWNHWLLYYPGDEYVDVIGLTGYNTGTYFSGERWREFSAIYAPLYQQYSALFAKPFMITEFASNSVGGDKVAWIQRMFAEIRQFNRIKLAVWWSGVDYDQAGQPGRIYLLDENDKVVEAFREGFKGFGPLSGTEK